MRHQIVHTRQTAENECGLCCISIMASFYGYRQPLSFYRNKYNIGRDGLSLYNVNTIFNKIGFDTEVYKIHNLLDYSIENGINIPILLHLKNNHFIVAIPKKRYVLIYDPIKEPYKTEYKILEELISGYILIVKLNDNFKKISESKSEFRHFFPVIKKSFMLLMIVLAMSLISYLISIVVPLIMQKTINMLIISKNINFLMILESITFILGIFCFVSFLRNKFFIQLQVKLNRLISFETIQHLFKIKYSFYDNRSQGNILYRLNLLTQIQTIISNEVLNLVLSFTSIIVICLYFLVMYSSFFSYILFIMVTLFFSVGHFNRKILSKKRLEMAAKENVENIITEIVNNMFQIKCLHLDDFFLKNYTSSFFNYEEKFINSQKSIQTFSTVINAIFNYLPIYGIVLIIALFKNDYSIGELFALYSFFTTLFSQCYAFVNEISTFSLLKASLFYLNDLLDEPEKQIYECQAKKVNNFKNLKIESVYFQYNNFSNYILQDINLEIRAGEKIAVVGLSGSGKTTLTKLLSNLYKPTKGSIQVNGLNINNIDSQSIINLFSFVPQSPVIFNKSIRDNVTLGDQSYSDEDVINSLKQACIWNDVQKMPMGLYTIISGQGGNLSGGQIQRISLARALLKKPQILIMDEATSSLDVWNEKNIYFNLKKQNISQIIISHRLSTIKDADCIYVLSNGMFVEKGNHDELMNLKKIYYDLFKNQN